MRPNKVTVLAVTLPTPLVPIWLEGILPVVLLDGWGPRLQRAFSSVASALCAAVTAQNVPSLGHRPTDPFSGLYRLHI